MLSRPVQGAFLDGVDVAEQEDSHKAQHAPEEAWPMCCHEVLEDHSPWIHEDNLDIENNEEHCHEVELNAEAGLNGGFRDDTTLVNHIFRGVPLAGSAKDHICKKCHRGEANCDDHVDKNRRIGIKHG